MVRANSALKDLFRFRVNASFKKMKLIIRLLGQIRQVIFTI